MTAKESLAAVEAYELKLDELDRAHDAGRLAALAELRKNPEIAAQLNSGLSVTQLREVWQSRAASE